MTTLVQKLSQNGFDASTFINFCRRKWASFAEKSKDFEDEYFKATRLVGVIERMTENRGGGVNGTKSLSSPVPIVFAEMPSGVELGERSSRKRQFAFAKFVIEELQARGIPGIHGVVCAGLFVFFDENKNFRLSLVSGTINPETRKSEFNSFRRQSFFVRKGEPSRTFCDRLLLPGNTLEELREIFSVEKLTKEFYGEIEKWFLRARESVRFPGADFLGKSDSEHQSNMTLRLITRLIFVWFLKAKGLVPAELFDKSKVDTLLKFNDSTGSTYYKAILQNLFFATLNVKISERAWVSRQTGNQDYFRYKRFFKTDKKAEYIFEICGKVPFVNGGLFENLDIKNENDTFLRIDCFSNKKSNEGLLFVPDALFFEENGIISILNRYNFTIEENAPADEDVSLDPELLGRVFENLLAFVNPETQEQARKSSGSFYTPREIVNYMVNESLIAYLKEKCGNEALIEKLVRTEEDISVSPKLREKISSALDSLKLLDPACGSGAFPMGALTKMLDLYEKIGAVDSANSQAVHDKKLSIIRNSIYGVDIQNIAVQISKLRFFISLLCDQKTNGNKAQNYGVSVLPNLESKLVCANTLIALPQAIGIAGTHSPDKDLELEWGETSEIRTLWENLKKDRLQYFSAKDKTTKRNLRKNDKKNRETLRRKLIASAGTLNSDFKKSVELIADWDPYKPGVSAPFFDPVWMFGFDTPDCFDIVIGNPPYIQLQKNHGELAEIYKNSGYETFARTGDIYSLFYEKGFLLLKSKAHLCFITSNKWMRAGYGEATRNFFAKKTNPQLLIDFAGTKVFDAATVDVNIILASKEENKSTTKSCSVSKLQGFGDLSSFIEKNFSLNDFTSPESWVIRSPIEQKIRHKVESVGVPLKDWDVCIYRGVLTGFNDAFIISGEKREEILSNCKTEKERARTAELICPILRGRDIKRYACTFADLWLVATFPARRYDIEDFPSLKSYFLQIGIERLEQTGRTHVVNGEKVHSRKKTQNKWFETQDSINYWEDFSKPKIVYPNMSKFLPFFFDTNGFMTNQKCFIITGEKCAFLAAFFNSSLFKYCFRDSFPELLGGTRELSKIFFDKIPVLKIGDRENLRFQKIVDDIQKEYTHEKARRIDEMIFDLYGLSADERKAIGFIEIQGREAGKDKSEKKSPAPSRKKSREREEVEGELEF